MSAYGPMTGTGRNHYYGRVLETTIARYWKFRAGPPMMQSTMAKRYQLMFRHRSGKCLYVAELIQPIRILNAELTGDAQ
jgi:hypothetical protein